MFGKTIRTAREDVISNATIPMIYNLNRSTTTFCLMSSHLSAKYKYRKRSIYTRSAYLLNSW